MPNYTTNQGDMWDAIAKAQYGTEAGMTALLEANPEYRHIAIFSAGVVLTVPTYEAESTSKLPPWRRG